MWADFAQGWRTFWATATSLNVTQSVGFFTAVCVVTWTAEVAWIVFKVMWRITLHFISAWRQP
jgi:hypothetical protein